MPRTLSDSVKLINALLGEVLTRTLGPDRVEAARVLRRRCASLDEPEADEAAEEIARGYAELSLDEITDLLIAYTLRFRLLNQAEQVEIARINRQREQEATAESPRAESIAEAIHQLSAAGCTLEQVIDILWSLDIQPTLTAHPTEARRRAVLHKQKRIARCLQMLQREDLPAAEETRWTRELRQLMFLSIGTDEVRRQRPRVIEEVRNGLYFLTTSIWPSVPQLYRDLSDALETHYQQRPPLPTLLRYRSWIGGDRDGHPGVTPAVTRETLDLMRETALRLFADELDRLRFDLSVSARRFPPPSVLVESLSHDHEAGRISEAGWEHLADEPYRLKVHALLERIRRLGAGEDDTLTASEFRAELRLLQSCLLEAGLPEVARDSLLADIIAQADTFGFHLAALDIRQHSKVHLAAVDELFRIADVCPNYAELGEGEKVRLLQNELANARPLAPRGAVLSDETQRVLTVFELIGEQLEIDADAIGSYIISMTHHVSDLLAVLLLMKETGLWRRIDGVVESDLDVVPLFETVEDLRTAAPLMRDLFHDDAYRAHLAARQDFQEMMLGYSDSNKDGGYWQSNWSLHRVQSELADVCDEAEIDFRFFHGRGGTVGRGGGRANRAILATPPSSRNGRIRWTEQGEVISFRYSLPAIARRHLEQIVNAMIVGVAATRPAGIPIGQAVTRNVAADAATDPELMDRIANLSMAAYRELIEDERFWEWFTTVSPFEHIGGLPIASRPAARFGSTLDFENVRAIPWVFGWTQMRYNVPGWYGTGAALQTLLEEDAETAARVQKLYREWPFFTTLINNAQQEMARARLVIARRYDLAVENGLHDKIAADYDAAETAILALTGQDALLDNNPVIQRSIAARNPWTDVLNFMQVELLDRYRNAADNTERERIRGALYASLNGVAAAMQSTG